MPKGTGQVTFPNTGTSCNEDVLPLFYEVTRVMKETGKDVPSLYRETALGGLAVFGDEDFVDN